MWHNRRKIKEADNEKFHHLDSYTSIATSCRFSRTTGGFF